MSEVSLEYFTSEFVKALEEGNAALFAGAGLSVDSGYVNWKELLRGIADELQLSVDIETDLIAVAQFHVNKFSGNRTKLDELLIHEFTKNAKPSRKHDLIAALPIDTVWTTNYDTLLEDTFEKNGKRFDKKTTVPSLAQTRAGTDVVIYKMHGDISQPESAVLTKDDYESYPEKRGLFSIMLQGDLVSKTFLFLGFSFTDPNIEYILSRVRALIGANNQRPHYFITRRMVKPKPFNGKKKADYEYASRKQSLVIGDLTRFGIQTVMIDDYKEIAPILEEIGKRVNRKSIFVSGSAYDYSPLGKDKIKLLCYGIGREIIKEGWNLVSGLGFGIGGLVSLGALEELYQNQSSLSSNKRTLLRPFPQERPVGLTSEELSSLHREDMISKSGIAIFISGNKFDKTSRKVIEADGVQEEWNLAKAKGLYPIPVGGTGYVARKIWDEVTASMDKYFPKGGVKQNFQIIGNENSSNEQIIDAIKGIIKRIT